MSYGYIVDKNFVLRNLKREIRLYHKFSEIAKRYEGVQNELGSLISGERDYSKEEVERIFSWLDRFYDAVDGSNRVCRGLVIWANIYKNVFSEDEFLPGDLEDEVDDIRALDKINQGKIRRINQIRLRHFVVEKMKS